MSIWNDPLASDQVSALAVGLPAFVLEVQRMSPNEVGTDAPTLEPDPQGNIWLVTRSGAELPRTQLWQWLLDPNSFAQYRAGPAFPCRHDQGKGPQAGTPVGPAALCRRRLGDRFS